MLEELDVIDVARSIMNKRTGGVVRPHLRAEMIGEHRVFTYAMSTGLVVLFTSDVVNAMTDLSGMLFSPVKATYSGSP
jgi:hypothetical protein